MTVDKSRSAAELELPPEAEEMMAKITELTGCIVVIPEEATRRLKETCESMGTMPPRFFAYILAAIETGVAGIFIQLWSLEKPGPAYVPDSEQVNREIHSWKEILQFEFRKFRPFRQLRPSEMSQLGTFPNISAWLPWFEYGSDHPLPCSCGGIIGL